MEEVKEFVIYTGRQPEITVSGDGLSRVYRLEKGKPAYVDSYQDKLILLAYKENVGGCVPCGTNAQSRPIYEDTTYCRYQRLDTRLFRKKWTEYWNNETKN